MAEIKEQATSVPGAGPKELKYVGPGSTERPNEKIPLISNLPLDIKQPRLGFDQNKYPANELPVKYIRYVMETNKAAKDWWK